MKVDNNSLYDASSTATGPATVKVAVAELGSCSVNKQSLLSKHGRNRRWEWRHRACTGRTHSREMLGSWMVQMIKYWRH